MQSKNKKNMGKLITEDWGLIDYAKAWEKQEHLFHQRIEEKKNGESEAIDRIIFCEHSHVYTLGRSGKVDNLLVSEQLLKQIGASFYHIDRGGDITYHGPGQLVCYPILDLERYGLGLKEYIHLLEEAVILLCSLYGIHAMRMDKATGVWLDVHTPRVRKICAIGVRSSKYVSMHGFALNVNTNLSYFNYINPCGFVDKGVTSLAQELQANVCMEEIKRRLSELLIKLLKKEI